MSRRPARFTEADVHRAMKAAHKVAQSVGMTVELDLESGIVRVIPIPTPEPKPAPVAEKRRIVL